VRGKVEEEDVVGGVASEEVSLSSASHDAEEIERQKSLTALGDMTPPESWDVSFVVSIRTRCCFSIVLFLGDDGSVGADTAVEPSMALLIMVIDGVVLCCINFNLVSVNLSLL